MPDLCLGQRRGNVCCTCKSINQCHEMRDHLLLLRGVHACFLTVVLRVWDVVTFGTVNLQATDIVSQLSAAAHWL